MSQCCAQEKTLLREGSGVDVSGSGTPTDPYIITAEVQTLSGILRVVDTDTIDHRLTGSGTTSDPFELKSYATLKVTNLADVQDPQGVPSAGESLVWVGTSAAGHWEYGTLPPAPAGAVNVTTGLSGVGSSASPIGVRLSSAATMGTSDLAIGVDGDGNLRAAAPSVAAVTWANISGKPTSFTPSSHKHAASDIDLSEQRKLDVGKVLGKTITSTNSSTTPPSNPNTGDLWFFPRG